MKVVTFERSSLAPLMRIAAAAGIVYILGTLADIVIGMNILSGEIPAGAGDPAGILDAYTANPLLGLYLMDFLNLLLILVTVPFFMGLTVAVWNDSPAMAGLAFSIILVATGVFASTNTALPLLYLSRQWTTVISDAERMVLISSAQTFLAGGAHGSPGVFLGFFLFSLGTFLTAIAVLRSSGFGRKSGILGVIVFPCFLLYTVLPIAKVFAIGMRKKGKIINPFLERIYDMLVFARGSFKTGF